MRLVNYAAGTDRRPGLIVDAEGARLVDVQRVLDFSGVHERAETVGDVLASAVMLDALRKATAGEAFMDQAVIAKAAVAPPTQLCQPLDRPLVVCCGHTFPGAEAMVDTEDSKLGWFIQNANSIIGSEEDIVLPPPDRGQVSFAGELAVVIARTCHRIDAEDAFDYVGGYTLVNDVCVVAPPDRVSAPGVNRFAEANLAKQFPTFLPMGPAVVTADCVPDPSTLTLTTRVNGVLCQQETLASLHPSLPELIAWLSQTFEFRPGDVISTGSPPMLDGTGVDPYLSDSDVVEVEADGIGSLRNRARARVAVVR